jgi:hypothetical protein
MSCGPAVRAGLVALALVAGACSGDDSGAEDQVVVPDGEEPGPSGEGGSTYAGELEDGSTLTIELDVPADHPAVAPFEAFRAMTEAPEPTWIVAEITVPDGVDGTGRFVTFIEEGLDPLDDDPTDQADGVVASGFACSEIDGWFGTVEAPTEELTDAYFEVYDSVCGGQTLQVLAPGGETTTYVLVLDGPIPPFETLRAGLTNELAQRL